MSDPCATAARCTGCKDWRLTAQEAEQGYHSRPDHHPDCDGRCDKCPVEVQCGPVLDPSTVTFESDCLHRVHGGVLADDPDEWPCPVNCHDTRPWCECMCHGTDDDDDD